jgi:hypothetical protein
MPFNAGSLCCFISYKNIIPAEDEKESRLETLCFSLSPSLWHLYVFVGEHNIVLALISVGTVCSHHWFMPVNQ